MNRKLRSRRQFISSVARGTVGAIAASTFPDIVFGQDQNKPNVLFISVDDLNDWISCLGGHPDSVTPNLDRLASRSVLFRRAYCNAPICNPSRTSMLTGVRPSTSGVYDNSQPMRWAMPDAVTIMQHFMANGYYVTGRGKIYSSNSPDLVSWHDYIEKGDDPEPPIRPANGIQHERIRSSFDWGPLDVEDSEMDDYKIATWAEEVLNREHDRPFFLGCGLYKPHMPFAVPRKYHDLYPPDQIQLPHVNQKDLEDVPAVGQSLITPAYNDKVMETNNWRNAVSGFLASVRFADDMVGRVIDALDNSPHAKNTIVVLFGDHGWHLGEKLHWRKHALWEEATRTALMISAPGVSQAAVCERTVSLIDLYPTLNDLCGLTEREGLEGVSLRPLLEQPDQTWDRPVLTTHLKGNHSIRSERWRYIRYCDGTEELYDHENDKMEWTNLAGQAQYQNVIAAHKAWLPKHEAPDSKRRS